jgi:hypothetical protein
MACESGGLRLFAPTGALLNPNRTPTAKKVLKFSLKLPINPSGKVGWDLPSPEN